MFLRLIIYPLLAVLIITLLRYLIGSIARAFSETFLPSQPRRQNATPAGELKRDPVCGTYVATTASVKMTVGDQVLHFCSNTCRNKYAASRK
jgi:YHS domain-containing protein